MARPGGRLVLGVAASIVLGATASGCVATDNPGVPFDVRAETIGIAQQLEVRQAVTLIHLADGSTVEADASHLVTNDPRPGDLVLAGADPRWVGTFSPDGRAGDAPCYRVDGDASPGGDGIQLTVRATNRLPVRFTVERAPGWAESPPSGGRLFRGGATCLDEQGRVVSRR